MPFAKIEPNEIRVFPLASRKSKSDITRVAISPQKTSSAHRNVQLSVEEIAHRIKNAREHGASVMLAFGAHLIKNGLAPLVIKLMEKGWVTHIASNGAGGIHDWEFAWLGRSEEDVRANVADGTFGAWEETGKYINLAVQVGALQDMGYGESLGALIENERLEIPDPVQLEEEIRAMLDRDNRFSSARVELLQTIRQCRLQRGEWHVPHRFKEYSVFGAACRLKIPATIHPGIGYDIIYNNPFANGAALGRAAHTDYKIFIQSVTNLTNGVFLSVGSAIMAPQVFEKSLSFANNLKLQNNQPIIHDHLMVVNDLQQSQWDWQQGEPSKESPDYYFRFLKSFYRMGGDVHYIASDNRLFLLSLYHILNAHDSA